jgi:hypothetical protein
MLRSITSGSSVPSTVAAIADTRMPLWSMAAGVPRSVVSPTPSWPAELSPQHHPARLTSMAQLLSPPADTDRKRRPPAGTMRGRDGSAAETPLPS